MVLICGWGTLEGVLYTDVSFFLALAFVGAMVIIHWEFGRMEGLQETSDVIDSCERIAVGPSFCLMDGIPYAQHNTQHPQMMHQNMNE